MSLVHASACRDVARFLDRGIRSEGECLGLESVLRSVTEGSFLTDDLTLEMLRGDEFFQNPLFGYSESEPETRRSMLERAHERVETVAAGFFSPLPGGELQEKLRRYFHDARTA